MPSVELSSKSARSSQLTLAQKSAFTWTNHSTYTHTLGAELLCILLLAFVILIRQKAMATVSAWRKKNRLLFQNQTRFSVKFVVFFCVHCVLQRSKRNGRYHKTALDQCCSVHETILWYQTATDVDDDSSNDLIQCASVFVQANTPADLDCTFHISA